ncbi:ABC transporter substrate-binding protein [Epidermidibacterium keratini]|uniref:ABC transporter substrate-binding protein n=1 Tax=Epidermidibacterium keratini TaxID=1891644 RepID=A0A7L4YPQ9_9ACTN|nr:ABC transporter substrate-binding protein [Epidermidibacterium keratini]QHC01120.1 ABC transporter substrate-binding protein [Epidermidibacterium keratini]
MDQRRLRRAAPIALAVTVGLGACTTGASDKPKESNQAPDVTTDVGVSGDQITLGVLADATNEYSTSVTRGGELWAAAVNEDGGICGRDVTLNVQDATADPAVAPTAYESGKSSVLGYLQLGGDAATTALAPSLATDGVLAVTDAPDSLLLAQPEVMVLGPTYDVQAINGLAWLAQQDQLTDGAIIAHVRNDSPSATNAALGVAAYAAERGLQVIDIPVGASDTDLTAAMTSAQQQGATAVVLSVSPAATTSAAIANKALGLDVPLVAGSESFSPAVLADVTATAAYTQLNFVQGFAPISASVSAAKDLASAYADAYGDDAGPGVTAGYVAGLAWQQILQEACDSKDLSRAGVQKARESVGKLDTSALSVAIDLGEPSRESVIVRTDPNSAGKLVLASEPFASDEADNYQLP